MIKHQSHSFFQIDPANVEGLKSRLEQKDKEICALKQAAKVSCFIIAIKRCHHQIARFLPHQIGCKF